MNAVVREEGVVGELVVLGREELFEVLLAELLLGLAADALAVPKRPLTQKAANGQVHGMVGGDGVDAPYLDALLK